MSDPVRLTAPLDSEDIRELRTGDIVRLSGVIYTARDAAHAWMAEAATAGEPLPFDPEGQVIYFTGPAPARPGHALGPAGPTTASRMDPYSPLLVERGLRGMIGKGTALRGGQDGDARARLRLLRSRRRDGGAFARCVKEAEIIAYEDLGTEAIRKLVVEDFPAVVVNDLYGGDLYREGRERWRRKPDSGQVMP
jgi:fumarate hydratase subunit beta